MRIALLAHTLPHDELGGSQDYVVALATGLSTQHEVAVFSGSGTSSNGLFLRPIPRLAPLDPRASAWRKMQWHLRDQWSLRQHRRLVRDLQRFRPDVIHSHQCQGLTGAVFSAIAAYGVPHVHTAHDLNLLCPRITMAPGGRPCRGRCLSCLVQRSVKGGLASESIDYLLAPSEFVQRLHIAAGVVEPSRTSIVRYGVKPGSSRVRGRLTGPLRVGYIGTLSEHKGLHTLLDAVELAEGHWHLHIAGVGPLMPDVVAAAEQKPRITYHGHLVGDAKDRFYDGLDLLVVPSEYAENAPLVLVEAGIRALPSIVSDQGGLPETPLSKVVPARSPNRLAIAIDRFEEEPDTLRAVSMALASRKREFSLELHLERVSNVLVAVERGPHLRRQAVRPALHVIRRPGLRP